MYFVSLGISRENFPNILSLKEIIPGRRTNPSTRWAPRPTSGPCSTWTSRSFTTGTCRRTYTPIIGTIFVPTAISISITIARITTIISSPMIAGGARHTFHIPHRGRGLAHTRVISVFVTIIWSISTAKSGLVPILIHSLRHHGRRLVGHLLRWRCIGRICKCMRIQSRRRGHGCRRILRFIGILVR